MENGVGLTLMGLMLAVAALFGLLWGVFGAILFPVVYITFMIVLIMATRRRVRRDPEGAAANAERLTTEVGKIWARASGGWAPYEAEHSRRRERDDEDDA